MPSSGASRHKEGRMKIFPGNHQCMREFDLREALETTFTAERFFAARERCFTDESSRGVVFFADFMIFYCISGEINDEIFYEGELVHFL